jgi:hypothetical protein
VTEFYLNLFRSRLKLPKRLFLIGLNAIRFMKLFLHKTFQLDTNRFLSANWIKQDRNSLVLKIPQNLEVVVVSTKKDFETLSAALEFASLSLGNFNQVVFKVIVPSDEKIDCEQLMQALNLNITVVDEFELISSANLEILRNSFQNRATWVYQQLLKVWAVKYSAYDNVLILDSDTLLLNRRIWFNSKQQQILMPSDEFNSDYYKFLNILGISEESPDYTFISHHMLMQTKVLRDILENCGITHLDDFLNFITSNANLESSSPVCLEYELYGQYIYNKNPDIFFLEKWSNLSLNRSHFKYITNSKMILFILSKLYHSISFHSWSNSKI